MNSALVSERLFSHCISLAERCIAIDTLPWSSVSLSCEKPNTGLQHHGLTSRNGIQLPTSRRSDFTIPHHTDGSGCQRHLQATCSCPNCNFLEVSSAKNYGFLILLHTFEICAVLRSVFPQASIFLRPLCLQLPASRIRWFRQATTQNPLTAILRKTVFLGYNTPQETDKHLE